MKRQDWKLYRGILRLKLAEGQLELDELLMKMDEARKEMITSNLYVHGREAHRKDGEVVFEVELLCRYKRNPSYFMEGRQIEFAERLLSKIKGVWGSFPLSIEEKEAPILVRGKSRN